MFDILYILLYYILMLILSDLFISRCIIHLFFLGFILSNLVLISNIVLHLNFLECILSDLSFKRWIVLYLNLKYEMYIFFNFIHYINGGIIYEKKEV